MRAFPWEEAMAFAFGVLRLPPSAFWAMTPGELALSMRPWTAAGGKAPGRGELDRLMRQFPDSRHEENG